MASGLSIFIKKSVLFLIVVTSIGILNFSTGKVFAQTGDKGCGQSCINTADCKSPDGITTVTCSISCGTTYCVGPNGICSCTTASSTHCPADGPWTAWSACSGGYQIRWCSVWIQDTQIQACSGPGPTGTPVPTASPPPAPTCTISLSPPVTNLTVGGVAGTITATVSCTAPVDGVAFSSSNTSIVTVSPAAPAQDTTSPYTTTVTAVANGSVTVTGTVFSGGAARASATATVNVSAPVCTITLSPAVTNLTLGGASSPITATVSCTAPVDQVTFSSSNSSVVTVSPGSDPTSPYTTSVTGVSTGAVIITGSVYAGGSSSPITSATAVVNSAPLGAWFQVKDSDVFSGGSINAKLMSGKIFDLNGSGGYPGVPVYQTSTDLTPATVSSTGWLVQNTAVNPRIYDYRTLTNLIPADTVFTNITTDTIPLTTFTSGGTLSYGYYWYKYDGLAHGLPLKITNTSSATLGSRKVILLVDSEDLNIQGNIPLTDGQGFFMAVVGKTSSGTKGNIIVDSSVGDGVSPNLEGIYVADGTFNDSPGNKALYVRGSVVAYGGTSLLRDLVALNTTSPAELFEFAPDQIMLYPSKLSIRKLNWKEITPQ